MKAEFRKTKTADGLLLTFGKMYDVIDIVAGSRMGQVKEIKITNDLGQECWYLNRADMQNIKMCIKYKQYINKCVISVYYVYIRRA